MQRVYSKIIGTPVYEEDFGRPITTVKDLVIDPETGKVLALVVNVGKNLIISPVDIISWTEVVRVHSRDVIVPGDDILRVEAVQKLGIKIYKNKVFTKDNENLGIVVDFTIDEEGLQLTKIFVAKIILGLVKYDSRIISAKNISEILPEKIVVDVDTKVKEEEAAATADLAAT